MVVVVVAVVVASAPAVGVVGVIAGAAAAGYDATVVFVVVIVIVVVVDQAEADILYLPPPLVTALRAFLAKAMPPIPRQQLEDLVLFRRRREVHRRAGRVVLVADVDV
jgi:hypothetical protein